MTQNASEETAWIVAKAEINGKPRILRFRENTPENIKQEDYPFLITILWEYQEVNDSGMPPNEVAREQDAFEKISELLYEKIHDNLPLDGLYLDLHGAMVTTELEDAEGELLTRIRKILKDKTPIIVSLDFHANISTSMLELSTLMTAYRTYPHIDMVRH